MTNEPIATPTPAQPLNDDAATRLTLAELQAAVWRTDPEALLVLPRILRRVIKQDCQLAGFGLRVPHRKSYVIGRDALLEIVEIDELGRADEALAARMILLARPSHHKLANLPAAVVLTHYWRMLFHSRVHAALDERVEAGQLSASLVRLRIQQLGAGRFDEIRTVLGHEGFLLRPGNDESVYAEFVAVYLELRHFAGRLLPYYFPSLDDLGAVDAIVRQDVDDRQILAATQLDGALDPKAADEFSATTPQADESAVEDNPALADASEPSGSEVRRLMRKAQRPAALGNVVRAAICRARAARSAPPELIGQVQSAIKMDVYRLIRRLGVALDKKDIDQSLWEEPLVALVQQTTRGVWTHEARLLFDLQKACVDHEREVYTIDLLEWVRGFGRRPIKRQLPNQRDVLMLKHLRSAARRLSTVRLSDELRQRLDRLIDEAVRHVESRLRRQLRPKVVAGLDAVKLVARNLPERVARKKLVEELLDQIVDRGFSTMGDLRDAISRNNLKLPDLSEIGDFLRGDQLLQADRKLSVLLDGVYRRGEFYLRWMQRISSLGFGTRTGRFVTRFAVVPFGGAYVTLVFLRHVLEWLGGTKEVAASVSEGAAVAEQAVEGMRMMSLDVFALGMLLLLVFNSSAFRHAIATGFAALCNIFQAVVIESIRGILQAPWLQALLRSRAFTLAMRFVVKPLAWTVVVWLLLPIDVSNRPAASGSALSIFLAVNLLVNSRVGRTAEEIVFDWMVQSWHRFGLRLITGLFWWIVDLFKGILEAIERLMYVVDEWLRFRGGESRLSLATKVVVGLVWRPVAYVLRFAVNVLIEPQINPIKHFPVVTVGHKLLLGLYKPFADLLEMRMGMAAFEAWMVATTVLWGMPGAFGFLVWELTANWRLYAANRWPQLQPVGIGPHGETMARLLRPGFHSGTLPKRYAKLRRAERHAAMADDGHSPSADKHLRVIAHIEAEIRRYIEREFLELFAQSEAWLSAPPALCMLHLGTNRVMMGFSCDDVPGETWQLALESHGGWIVAGVTRRGWTERLSAAQCRVLVVALVGLYKSAGVDLVREQIAGVFRRPMAPYDLSPTGLRFWPEADGDVEVLYDLHNGEWIAPQSVRGLARKVLPTVERRQLVFRDVIVPWDKWVAAWSDGASVNALGELLPETRVWPT